MDTVALEEDGTRAGLAHNKPLGPTPVLSLVMNPNGPLRALLLPDPLLICAWALEVVAVAEAVAAEAEEEEEEEEEDVDDTCNDLSKR